MHGLKEMLLAEQARLEEIIEEAEQQLDTFPEGKLRLSKRRGRTQYYYVRKGEKEKYIRRENEGLIQQLAQKEYDEELLCLSKRRLKQFQKITKDYDDNEIEEVYYQQHLQRQKFIQPIETTWEQRLAIWKAKEYVGKEFAEDSVMILTEKGERVRSKSEKILADCFIRMNIPYKYESPLYLKGVGIVYPDFTFLSKRTGCEMYWEHCGRMDDPTYAKNAIRKIKTYEKNGIFQGDRLIVTYETEQEILNTREIERIIDRYLK